MTIFLGPGFDLDPRHSLTATILGVAECHGNAIAAPGVSLSGSCSGYSIDPFISGAFVDFRADSNGGCVEVRFNAVLYMSWCGDLMNWDSDGGSVVAGVDVTGDNSCTLYLVTPFAEGQTIDLSSGLEDTAGNTAGDLSFAPVF